MDFIIDHIKSNPGTIAGILLLIVAFLNSRRATEQQDTAFDMPENTDTDRICRHIRLLETRVWVIGHWIVFSIGLVLVFI